MQTISSFDKWIDLISENIPEKTRNLHNLVTLIKNYSKEYIFIEIKDKDILESFNNIAENDFLISYDIEFISAIAKKNNFKSHHSRLMEQISFIRELGIVIFIKNYRNKKWYYVGNIFINFPHITNYEFNKDDIRFEMADYSTVTEPVLKRMQDIENNFQTDKFIKQYLTKLNMKENIPNFMKNKKSIMFEIIRKYLESMDKNYIQMFDEQFELYFNDQLVINRIIDLKEVEPFLKEFSNVAKNSTFVVKGKRDIEAFHNHCKLIKKGHLATSIENAHYYDIEIFNNFSRRFFKNARLESTFEGLTNTPLYNKNIKKFFNPIIKNVGKTAHNPVTDSLFTIIVALIINLALIKYFSTQVGGLGGNHAIQLNKQYNKNYRVKYIKYKTLFKLLKNY